MFPVQVLLPQTGDGPASKEAAAAAARGPLLVREEDIENVLENEDEDSGGDCYC